MEPHVHCLSRPSMTCADINPVDPRASSEHHASQYISVFVIMYIFISYEIYVSVHHRTSYIVYRTSAYISVHTYTLYTDYMYKALCQCCVINMGSGEFMR